MSYQNSIEQDRPTVYKTFDDATNKSHPLVAGLGNSAVITTTPFTHTFDEWTYGPFTIEVWFKPLNDSVMTVVGHDDDGIVYDGTTKTMSFTVKLADGSLVTTSQPASFKAMYVVAQYTGYSAVLMVNGVQSSVDVMLPLQATGQLKSGGGRMSIDALAMYRYLLNDDQMYRHYIQGVDFPITRDVYSDAENYYKLTDDRSELVVSLDYPDWSRGYTSGPVVNSEGFLTRAGDWMTSVILPDDQKLYGGKINFECTGTKPVVQATLDGVTWSPVVNEVFPLIPSGQPLPDADPVIKFTLSDDTILESVRVIVYASDLSRSDKENRFAQLVTPALTADEEMFPFEQDDDGGVQVNGGNVIITADTEDGSANIRALSFWYKGSEPDGGSKNGGAGHVDGQWNFFLKTFTANKSAQTIVSNFDGRIANVATWVDAPDSASLYTNHFVKPTILVRELDGFTFDEVPNGVKVYQNNWYML